MLRVHVAALAPRFLDVRARLPAEALDSLPDLVVTRAETIPRCSPLSMIGIQRGRIGSS